jgi:hypothetical protein
MPGYKKKQRAKRPRVNDDDDAQEQSFAQKDIDSFTKKYSVGLPKECSVAIIYRGLSVGNKTLSRCLGGLNPLFAMMHCIEIQDSVVKETEPPPGRQALTKIHKLYAASNFMHAAIYSQKCNECVDRGDQRAKKSKEKKAAKIAAGGRLCEHCPESNPEHFENETNPVCKKCQKKRSTRSKDLMERKIKARPKGSRYCYAGNHWPDKSLFSRRLRNMLTGEIKTNETLSCGPCLDICYKNHTFDHYDKLEEIKKEQDQEKLVTLQSNHHKGNFHGCCKSCPFKLLSIKKLLTDIFGEEKGNRIFFSTLEWDHRDVLTKCRNVSEIYLKEERLEEIAECDLLCIFCHRLKTYINGDNIVQEDGSRGRGRAGVHVQTKVTRRKFREYLEWKRLRLEATDGCCPGYGPKEEEKPSEEVKACPFQEGLRQFFLEVADGLDTSLSLEYLLLLAHDFDHDNRAEKLGQVFYQGWDEALKCTVRCCYCHRVKTYAENDFNPWVALKHGSEEPCYLVCTREAEEQDVEREVGDWRIETFG